MFSTKAKSNQTVMIEQPIYFSAVLCTTKDQRKLLEISRYTLPYPK